MCVRYGRARVSKVDTFSGSPLSADGKRRIGVEEDEEKEKVKVENRRKAKVVNGG
jgi:hypothetical protein